jgi:hypothetical protein
MLPARRLVLVRHGRPAHPRGGWYDAAALRGWFDAYDAAGLAADDAPPPALAALARDAAIVAASDLPRAEESAVRLAPDAPVVLAPLLRETLPAFPALGPVRLPLAGWASRSASATPCARRAASRRRRWPSSGRRARPPPGSPGSPTRTASSWRSRTPTCAASSPAPSPCAAGRASRCPAAPPAASPTGAPGRSPRRPPPRTPAANATAAAAAAARARPGRGAAHPRPSSSTPTS